MAKQALKQAAPKRAPATRKKAPRTLDTMTAAEVVAAPISTLEPSHSDISQRAFELFQARGGMDGDDMHDWLTAERQLRSA